MLAQANGDQAPALGGLDGRVVLAVTVLFLILAGLVVLLARVVLEGRASSERKSGSHRDGTTSDRTIMRSWLAISLVGAMIVLSAASFGLSDSTLRSLLIGGLVSTAGSAVAFYFASKSSDQARKDILSAALARVNVPKVVGMSPSDVRGALAAMPLQLATDPKEPADTMTSTKQDPQAHQLVPFGTTVTVTFEAPPGASDPAKTAATGSTGSEPAKSSG